VYLSVCSLIDVKACLHISILQIEMTLDETFDDKEKEAFNYLSPCVAHFGIVDHTEATLPIQFRAVTM